MGDEQTQPGTEVERLEREAAQKYWDLRAALEQLDQARAQVRATHKTPEERRRSFRLIQGGATVVGTAAVWAWETARKPALAVVAGTGTLTTAALVTAPMIEPGTASELPPPAVVFETPVRVDDTQRERPTPEPVAETPPPSAVAEVPVAPVEEPFTPAPTQTPKPSPKPSLSPVPSPTATVTAEVEDLVEIEVTAEDGEACVDSGLVGLELAVCLEGVR